MREDEEAVEEPDVEPEEDRSVSRRQLNMENEWGLRRSQSASLGTESREREESVPDTVSIDEDYRVCATRRHGLIVVIAELGGGQS